MTSAAHGSPRLACCRVAGRRRAARCRRLRGEIERHAFNIEFAQLAQHGIHRRRCARAGQQPSYFVTATQEYLTGARASAPMDPMLRKLGKLDVESVALYFASQTPAPRSAPR